MTTHVSLKVLIYVLVQFFSDYTKDHYPCTSQSAYLCVYTIFFQIISDYVNI